MAKAKPKKTTGRELTQKQKLFAAAWVITGGNATEAARKAGYKGNDVTLASCGYEVLRNPQVKALIDEISAKADTSPKPKIMKARRILERLTMIAEGDSSLTVGELHVTPTGEIVRDPRKFTPEVIEHMRGHNGDVPDGMDVYYHPPVKVSDQRAALVDLAKIFRLYEDQTQPTAVYVVHKLIPALGLPADVQKQVFDALAKVGT